MAERAHAEDVAAARYIEQLCEIRGRNLSCCTASTAPSFMFRYICRYIGVVRCGKLTLMLLPLGRCLSTLPPRVFGLKLYWNASSTLLPRARFVRDTMNKMMATSRIIIVVRTTMTTPMKFASFGS